MAPEFTAEQLSAVEYVGRDACVVAGPGSGKTTVLVERYRQLVELHGFEPRQILAITFTEKAAANMKAKLASRFRDDPVRLRELEAGWVSTIHGFCARLLRENAIAAGIDPRFSVLSPRESEILQWECLNNVLDDLTAKRRDQTLHLIEALNSPRLTGDLKEAYDAMRSAGMSVDDVRALPNAAGNPDVPATAEAYASELRNVVRQWPFGITPVQSTEKARLLQWCDDFEAAATRDFTSFLSLTGRLKINKTRTPPGFKEVIVELRERMEKVVTAETDRHTAPSRSLILDALARFDEEYRNRKNILGRIDFNDLERHAISLLKNDATVKSRVGSQFRQIMLDEFQDINGQQAELIMLLRSKDVFFGVGDSNQSIYGFRHARPEIFLQYDKEVRLTSGQSVALTHNFRSRAAILECVRTVLTGLEGILDRDLVPGAAFAGKDGPSIEVLKLHDKDDDREATAEREAAWIAHRIHTLRNTLRLGAPGDTRAAEFRDFAVLCRNGDSMEPILLAFNRAGIPYVCGRRQSFLLSREGLDITALLSVISNPRDSISLATVLRSPLVGLSDEGLLRLRLLANGLTGGLNAWAYGRGESDARPDALPEEEARKLTRFCKNLERWRRDQLLIPPDVLLARALSDCGLDWKPATVSGANVESFLHLARTAGESLDLQGFLKEIESLADATDTEADLADEDQGNCVQVMTAHAAKGLEFPITIVAAMDKGARRESRPISFTPEHGLGVKWRNPEANDEKKGLLDSWAEANKAALQKREDDEEDRLLYVAMTRAAEHLILSYSRVKNRPSNWVKILDDHFGLKEVAPASEPRIEERDGFSVSILVTESDPPDFTLSADRAGDADAPAVPRPVITDQHETAVTVTSLAVFGTCPRKYYIQRSLGWNSGRFRRFDPGDIDDDEIYGTPDDESDGDLGAARVGSAVHEILASATADPVYEGAAAQEAGRLADVFRCSDLGKRAAVAARKAHEWAFVADIDGVIVRGSIDLWFEENGNLHLVDYKTDDVTTAATQARARDYTSQLALYALALERALGFRPTAAWLHFLRTDTVIEVPLDDPALQEARSLIARLREAQDEIRFNLNEGEHCQTCQFYRSLCPAGRQSPERRVETA